MIDNPEALKFCNEIFRPLAERIRNGDVVAQEAWQAWTSGKSALFPDDDTAVADGREKDGVSRLTGADVHAFMLVVAQMGQLLDAKDIRSVVRKPCVRNISIGE